MTLPVLVLLFLGDPGDGASKKLLPLYLKEAETYSMSVESAPDGRLELKKEPVFQASNPARSDQHGAAYLWLRDGRPAALGYVFSVTRQNLDGRQFYHELHALDPEKLTVKREEDNKWEPKAGLVRQDAPGAKMPSSSPAARRLQLRKIARQFSGHSVDREGKRWDLRLLPTPLFRYPTAEEGVVDGALFAMVSNAGTDPEVLLVVEAVKGEGGLAWRFACGRFSDWPLHVVHQGKEVFTSVRDERNPFHHDEQHLYRIYPEKRVSPEGELIARIRQLPQGRPVIIPVGGDE